MWRHRRRSLPSLFDVGAMIAFAVAFILTLVTFYIIWKVIMR